MRNLLYIPILLFCFPFSLAAHAAFPRWLANTAMTGTDTSVWPLPRSWHLFTGTKWEGNLQFVYGIELKPGPGDTCNYRFSVLRNWKKKIEIKGRFIPGAEKDSMMSEGVKWFIYRLQDRRQHILIEILFRDGQKYTKARVQYQSGKKGKELSPYLHPK